MTRLSRYLLPTEKQPPADAEAISHKLMVRAGLIRQMGAGMWTWLPAGWRVHQRAVSIIREEMNAIGPGEKFADAELLGCPLRLTVGRRSLESGEIEVQERRARTAGPPLELASEPAQLLRAVDELWQSLP